jgi:hypothetical protein
MQIQATRRKSEVSLPDRLTAPIVDGLPGGAQDSREGGRPGLIALAAGNVCVFFSVRGCYQYGKGMNEDSELLRNHVQDGSQPAFTELVRLHFDLVYSAALRPLGSFKS